MEKRCLPRSNNTQKTVPEKEFPTSYSSENIQNKKGYKNDAREKDQATEKDRSIRIIAEFSRDTLKTTRALDDAL